MGILESLERKRREYEEEYYIPELKAFYTWAVPLLVKQEEIVCLYLPHQKEYVALSPRGENYQAKSLGHKRPQREIAFVVCQPEQFPFIQKQIRVGDWHLIFRGFRIEIWENKDRFYGKVSPLRFGCTDEEKKVLIQLARLVLHGWFGKSETRVRVSNERLSEVSGACVALWVRGELRGSAIVSERPFHEGVVYAMRQALSDKRFHQLESDEVSQIRVEITLIHSLHLPLTEAERQQNEISTSNAYQLSDQGKIGWFMPEVFNFYRFINLGDFLNRLSKEKANTELGSPSVCVTQCMVDDWIEDSKKNEAISLWGPVPIFRISESMDWVFRTDLDKCLVRAAENLMWQQKNNGLTPTMQDPLTGEIQTDPVRLAFSVGALILSGQMLGRSDFITVGERSLEFLLKNKGSQPELARVYLAKALWLFDRKDEARALYRNPQQGSFQHNPIASLQAASWLLRCGESMDLGRKMLWMALADYDSRITRGEYFSLALFPEAIAILQEHGWEPERQKAMLSHLASFQRAEGSFRKNPMSQSFSTRGTGKIFEALVLEPERHQQEIIRLFTWLKRMQYTEESAFFIAEKTKKNFIGGFRHTMLDTKMWSDTTSHVIVALCRLRAWLYSRKVEVLF